MKFFIYFFFGKCCINIIYIKLRYNCVLNYDFCKCNIINNLLCLCGKIEDVYYFFFFCKKYFRVRNNMFD